MTRWKEKISYKDMVMFCSNWRTLKEISKRFETTPMQTHKAVKWFCSFKEDFVLDRTIDAKAMYIKSTQQALDDFS